MKLLHPESVHLICTSPDWPGRMGGPHPDDYVAWFMPFVREFWRVLRHDGNLILNVKEPLVEGERHTCILSLIIAMKAMGWRWHDEYPGVKTRAFPSGARHRLRDGFERNLHFTKAADATFYRENIKLSIGDWAKRERRLDDWMVSVSGTGSGFRVRISGWKNRQFVTPPNVLYFASETRNLGHKCPFPEAVPDFFIRLLTQPGHLVLDPFVGSGTTVAVAKKLGRSGLGFDQNRSYCRRAAKRVADTAPGR